MRLLSFLACAVHVIAFRFDAPANSEYVVRTVPSACEKKLQMLEEELLEFCQKEQEGLKNGAYSWLTHVRDVHAAEMARNVMHALRWGKRDASHGLLFTKKAFYDHNSTLLLWSGVSPSSRGKWCASLNTYMLQADGNDDIQTPFGSILDKIKIRNADEDFLQGCGWPQQEPIWQAASDAVVWRNGDALVRFLVKKPLRGTGSLRDSIFFRAELPTLARYPPVEGLRVLNEHPRVRCHHLMPIIKDRIESNGLLDDWRKVKTFSCVDVGTPPNPSEYKKLDSRATEFLKPGEQPEAACAMDLFNFTVIETYKRCRARGRIDFTVFQDVARQLPESYVPEITSLRLPQLSKNIKQLPAILPDIVEMFDSSIPLELCLWSSLEVARHEAGFDRETLLGLLATDLRGMCREGARKLLPGLRKALGDSDSLVRQAAAGSLKTMGEAAAEAVPELLEALHDVHRRVRSAAAVALGSVGKEAKQAARELLKATGDSDSGVRHAAAEALDSIAKEAAEAVLPQLRQGLSDADMKVRRAAAGALYSMGKGARGATAELRKALNDSEWRVRIAAARALGSLGKEAADSVLAELRKDLGDSDRNVRWTAIEALGSLGKGAEDAVPDLLEILVDSDAEVNRAVTDALGSIGKEAAESVLPELRKALQGSHRRVRADSARALGRIGNHAAVLELRKALGSSDLMLRRAAAKAMGSAGEEAEEALPELLKALGDSKWQMRKDVAETLGKLGKEEAVPYLLKALGDSEWHVRKAAADALGSIGKAAREAVPELQKVWVRDSDGRARKAA
ncbi:unnamed protein product, partial [Symbiodinium sp. CCMP2456]